MMFKRFGILFSKLVSAANSFTDGSRAFKKKWFISPLFLFLILALFIGKPHPSPVSAQEPIGVLDGINSEFAIWGWAIDLDTPSTSTDVHIYIDNDLVEAVPTNVLRSDVNEAHNVSGNHGFFWNIPVVYLDGDTHTLNVYAINTASGSNPELSQSPLQFRNEPPYGELNAIDGTFILSGTASDPDEPDQPIDIHFYIDAPAGQGELIGSTTTTSNSEFSWAILDDFRVGPRDIYAYAIDSAGGATNQLLSNSPQSTPPFGISQIGNVAGSSSIIIRTTDRLAGAIDSLIWNGIEFIDSLDHGRQMQSASSFDDLGECFNPTEAGSSSDGTGSTSTSKLQGLQITGNVLSTQTQMAFWLQPGEEREHCGQAQNTTPLSNHILNKQVTIGFQNMPHVIEYLTQFTIPETEQHDLAVFEAVTGYMPSNEPSNFNTFWLYDPSTQTLTQETELPPVPGSLGNFQGSEQALPVIVSTADQNYAMGVYSPDLPQNGGGYGRFNFPSDSVVKWNCVFRENAITPESIYAYRCFVIVGSLQNVTDSMNQLHSYFNPPDPPIPTSTPSPAPTATPSPIPNTKIAHYQQDFQSGTPVGCWEYLWNANSAIGSSSGYTPLIWDGATRYDSDGVSGLPDPTNLDWGHLHATGGHPGPGTTNGQPFDRFVIAACTVSEAGDYLITDSFISNVSPTCGANSEVRVFVNDLPISTKTIVNGGSLTFDTELGMMTVGDTIYIAVGPDAADGCDDFEWDFAIVLSTTTPPTPTSTPSPTPATTPNAEIAHYQQDFQSGTPAGCWEYLWNANSSIGSSIGYTPLIWDGVTRYDSDGVIGLPDPTNMDWGHLHATGGHPGPGAINGQPFDRYIIAACTVSEAGNYFIIDSFITNVSPTCGFGGEVRVLVNDSPILNQAFLNGESTIFDTELGMLAVGDTIYIAAGPDATDSCDDFEWDFTISTDSTGQ